MTCNTHPGIEENMPQPIDSLSSDNCMALSEWSAAIVIIDSEDQGTERAVSNYDLA